FHPPRCILHFSYTATIPLFFLLIPPPPRSTLFPYTTLFRSTSSVSDRCGLSSNTLSASAGSSRSKARQSVVLPVPTSPSRSMTPDRKSTRLNSSHGSISYAVFCLKKKTNTTHKQTKLVTLIP